MKKLFTLLLAVGVVCGTFAADAISRGTTKDAVCYFKGGKFYADAACKQLLYSHPGNMVGKEAKVTAQNAIYRLMTGRIYKGYSLKKEDCLATIFETKTQKGNTVEAKIYEGFVVPRDIKETTEKGGIAIKSCNISDGVNVIPGKVLFTVKDGKLFRGDSTDDKDCVLNGVGNLNSSRLLFVAFELVK